jgi:hypothetical protein
MKITETHLNMVKRYCEILKIDYQYQVGIDKHGKQEPAIAIYDNDFIKDGLGLFVLGYENKYKDEQDYLKKIESYFINQGKEQDRLLSGLFLYWTDINGKIIGKAYGDKLQCASISCKVSKKNKVKTSVDYGDDTVWDMSNILNKENK